MKKLIKILKWIIPVSLVLTVISAALLFFLPDAYPNIVQGSNGFGPFDFRLSYSADAVMTVLSHFDGDKESAYAAFFVFDYIFVACYTIFTFSVPLIIYAKDDKHYLLFRAAAFSSVMSMLFNVLENLCIMNLVRITPLFTDGDVNLSSGLTTLKWVFTGIWLLSTVFLLIVTAVDCVRKNKTKNKNVSKSAV